MYQQAVIEYVCSAKLLLRTRAQPCAMGSRIKLCRGLSCCFELSVVCASHEALAPRAVQVVTVTKANGRGKQKERHTHTATGELSAAAQVHTRVI